MTVLLVRSPLQTLSMTSTQRPTTRRRSARHAFDAEDQHDDAPAVKRSKTDAPAQVNGMGGKQAKANGTAAAGRRTRTAAYDEDDDGFTFSRKTRSKKTQKQPEAEPEPAPVPAPLPARKSARATKAAPAEATAPAPAPAKSTKKKSLAAIAPAVADEIAPKRRRSARLSSDHVDQKQQPAPVSTPQPEKPRARANKQAEKDKNQTPRPNDDSLALVGEQAQSDHSREGTKIALPFADTPIIKRNKEMRKGGGSGHRRSSTGLRGRRASSLIDSGTSNGGENPMPMHSSAREAVDKMPPDAAGAKTDIKTDDVEQEANLSDGTAVPHAEVAIEDFYKHIEDSLPEPRRMKQLLTWCGTRALPEKPSGEVKDASAIMAARAIQQELLNDFASKSEMSDWFNREDATPAGLVRKPNPRNVEMAAKVEELEKEVKRLQEEKKAWEALLKAPASILGGNSKESKPQPVPADIGSDIDTSLLEPEQARILASLGGLSIEPNASTTDSALSDSAAKAPSATLTQSQLSSRLQSITATLEPRIDLFADGVHKVAQYQGAAERLADVVLSRAAWRLEERDKVAREKAGTSAVGTGDVLRALGGVLGGKR